MWSRLLRVLSTLSPTQPSLPLPCPPGIGELKASQPSLQWQLPLAPVFQPTSHMQHGELGLSTQPFLSFSCLRSGDSLRWGPRERTPKSASFMNSL